MSAVEEAVASTAPSPVCERCGGPIGAERLEALPRAITCIACASLRKRPSRGRTCS